MFLDPQNMGTDVSTATIGHVITEIHRNSIISIMATANLHINRRNNDLIKV